MVDIYSELMLGDELVNEFLIFYFFVKIFFVFDFLLCKYVECYQIMEVGLVFCWGEF